MHDKSSRQSLSDIKLCLSDEETIAQIQENIYLQYFVGLSMYQYKPIFTPTLFVEIRKRMGSTVFKAFEQCIINAVEEQNSKNKDKNDDHDKPTLENKNSSSSSKNISQEKIKHQGKLIVDATVVEQAIRYPTDLSLLNEAREKTEQLIDNLCTHKVIIKKSQEPIEKRLENSTLLSLSVVALVPNYTVKETSNSYSIWNAILAT